VNRAVFHRPALPGDQLRYTAVLEGIEAEGAFIRGTSHVGDQLQAEVDLFLAHLGDRFEEVAEDLIDPADMLASLRVFGLYDVGRTPSGEPLDVAEKLHGRRTTDSRDRGQGNRGQGNVRMIRLRNPKRSKRPQDARTVRASS
jgi:hypothetical protein